MSATITGTPAGYVITTPIDTVIRHSMRAALLFCRQGGGFIPVVDISNA